MTLILSFASSHPALHFKLAVANDNDAKIHYEDATFLYTPRFDANRDRDLLELLPDYLSEEIAFSRVNAAKFYGRVVDTLTKRRTEDDVGQCCCLGGFPANIVLFKECKRRL